MSSVGLAAREAQASKRQERRSFSRLVRTYKKETRKNCCSMSLWKSSSHPATRRKQTLRCGRTCASKGEGVSIPSRFTTLKPEGQRILVKPHESKATTAGGIILPSDSLPRPTCGSVVAAGNQSKTLKDGQVVLYSKFGLGCLDVDMQGEEYVLMREQDVMGTLERVNDAEEPSKLVPIFDRILIRVDPVSETSAGGLVMPDSAKEKPTIGTVVRAGPGKDDDEGEFKATHVGEGDKVMYFKYAGEKLKDPEGNDYVVVHERDILCKV